MKILVTGAAGYIGSHFVKKALDRYPTVKICAVDDLREGHNQAVPDSERVTFHNLAMDNEAALDPVLAREKPVAVVHFAANAYVGESQEKP
ncbi:MAG: NAD-dependent epimerase/dehydratase family protein, partial [Cyanobacteria bacterium HKST-UBA01]|nr:NAD-dependent epimerase/dehydratase family protein [Cyanobacteria bacterium HKST-UBA01]